MKVKLTAPAGALAAILIAGCAEMDAPETEATKAPFTPEVTEMIDQYEATASQLSNLLGQSAAPQGHQALLDKLFDLAEGITPAFVARRPECKAYLDAALTVRGLWATTNAETLERDFHDDGALPSEGISPACYHMKDLIVHPASAAALMLQTPPDSTSAKREIDEVLAHVGVVRGG